MADDAYSRERQRKARLGELVEIAVARQLEQSELDELNTLAIGPEGGMDRTIGLVYTAMGPDAVTAAVTLSPAVHQPYGLTNGGLYCTVGESVGSFASIIASGGVPAVGVNNSTDFFKATSSGVLTATAEAVHLGRSQHLWRVTMTDSRGKLVAQTMLRTHIMSTAAASS